MSHRKLGLSQALLIAKVLQRQIDSFQNTLKGQSNSRSKRLAFSPIQVANTGQLHV